MTSASTLVNHSSFEKLFTYFCSKKAWSLVEVRDDRPEDVRITFSLWETTSSVPEKSGCLEGGHLDEEGVNGGFAIAI